MKSNHLVISLNSNFDFYDLLPLRPSLLILNVPETILLDQGQYLISGEIKSWILPSDTSHIKIKPPASVKKSDLVNQFLGISETQTF